MKANTFRSTPTTPSGRAEVVFMQFCLHRGVQLVFITRGQNVASGFDAIIVTHRGANLPIRDDMQANVG